MMDWIVTPARLGAAAALVGAYTALCAAIAWRARRQQRAAAQARNHWRGDGSHSVTTLVVYASQTGHAQALAQTTAHALRAARQAVQYLPIEQVRAEHLQQHTSSWWLLSTTGEGDAPDHALPFLQGLQAQSLRLQGHTSHVLALGDSDYSQFCAFGQRVHAWLQAQGAQGALLCMDGMQATVQQRWQQLLAAQSHSQAGQVQAVFEQADVAAQPWVLRQRSLLNPGSQGAPVYALQWERADGVLPDWQAGDLLEVIVPAEPHKPRDYSLASIPSQGCVQLLVRQSQRAGGGWGVASSWMCQEMRIGDRVLARVRAHPAFHLGGNAQRPLILIGNGTGLAGLLSLLQARIAQGNGEQWLLWGERSAAVDAWFDTQLQAWLQGGQLQRLDRAWSRDGGAVRYVQHLLTAHASTLQAWVARGAAIYVCGSRHGMGDGVEQALQQVLGGQALQDLQAQGRYCRDVY